MPLAEARETAFQNRKLARQGGDPLALKRRSHVPTFEEAARTVIEIHRPSWRNAKHAAQWDATLRQYAFPRLGKRLVSDIDTSDVMAVLLPIWSEKPVTAKRVRQRIGTVMKWAIAQGHRTDNPAGEAIGAALPKISGSKRHHAALPHAEVADAIEAVCESSAGMAVKLAFEFLVLTAARSGEVRLATWDEIDTDTRTWTVPAERMKANQEHRVLLCGRAMQILAEARALENATGFIFPGTQAGKPLSDMTLSKLMRDLNMGAVPHGFRSSFRDWCAETGNVRDVSEAALRITDIQHHRAADDLRCRNGARRQPATFKLVEMSEIRVSLPLHARRVHGVLPKGAPQFHCRKGQRHGCFYWIGCITSKHGDLRSRGEGEDRDGGAGRQRA